MAIFTTIISFNFPANSYDDAERRALQLGQIVQEEDLAESFNIIDTELIEEDDDDDPSELNFSDDE